MDAILTGSGLLSPVSTIENERCDACGERLEGKSMRIYDGVKWREVHARCAVIEEIKS